MNPREWNCRFHAFVCTYFIYVRARDGSQTVLMNNLNAQRKEKLPKSKNNNNNNNIVRKATLLKTLLLLCTLIVGVRAWADSQYTVKWSVNGEILATEEIEENAAITFTAPTSGIPAGYAFKGWSETEILTPQSSQPATIESAMCTNAVTYYAILAKETKESGTKTDGLDGDFTGVSGTNYSKWYDKAGESGAVYAGKSAISSKSIMLNKENYSSIVSTTSGGKVKKVTIVWNSKTADDRELLIYGKNSAYSNNSVGTNGSGVYSSSNQGTLLGSVVKGTSTELIISGDYTYIGLRPYDTNGAMYLKQISIEWECEISNYSDYCTTIPPLTAEISSVGWRTYAPAYPVRFREGTKAYIVSAEENNTEATLTRVTSVPANTPVLLNGEAGTHTMDVVASATSDVSGNCLHVSNGTNPDGDMYVLANVDNKLAFYLWDKTEGGSLPAGKIYLQLNNSPSARPFIALPDEETGIYDVKREAAITNNRYYDLQGRHVSLPTKGLYIVNGRKVMIK